MKRSKKRLFSWMLVLAITFTTIFGNVGSVYASEAGTDDSTVVQEITSEQPSTAQEEVLDENKGEDGQKQQNEENKEENQQTAEEGILQESSGADQKKVEESTPLESDGNDQNAGKGENSVTDSGSDEKTDKEDNLEQDSSKLPSEDAQKQEKVNLQPVIMKSTAPANAQQTSDAGVDAVSSSTIPVDNVTTIADALKAEKDALVTLKGVITMIDGRNVYLQDETGDNGICIYLSANNSDINIGDTIVGKGKKSSYNGMEQLSGGEVFKVKDPVIPLTSKEKTISELSNSDLGTYVSVKNLQVKTVEEYNDTGKYNVTLSDGTKEILLHKAVLSSADYITPGDTVDITVSVGIYGGNLQLRNTKADEVVKTQDGTLPEEGGDGQETTDGPMKVDISAATEIGTNYQVTGTVIMVYNGNKSGQEIYVRDTTGGIGVFLGKKNNNIAVGKVYTFTGVLEEYPNGSGLYQLKEDATSKSNSKTETPTVVEKASVKEITKADVYSYIRLKNMTVVKEGSKIYLQDAAGDKIQLYNPVLAKSGGGEIELTAGSVLDIVAAVGYYKTPQLRNSSGDEITVTKQVEATPDVDINVKAGDKVVIYNLGSKGVLAGQDDNTSKPNVNSATAELKDGKVLAGNGSVLFTVETNGSYYRFHNESYGYLYSKDTGSNAGYITKTELDSATDKKIVDWTVEKATNGFFLKSRGAVYNGNAQYLEFYDESYQTYGKKSNDDIFVFSFHPVSNPDSDLDGDIVNNPKVVRESKEDAYLGVEYKFSYKYDVPFGVKEMTVKLGQETLKPTEELGIFTVTVSKEKVKGDKLTFTFTGKDNKDKAINTTIEVPVLDEPMIVDVTPAAGSDLGTANKKPEIKATAINTGNNPTVVMTVNNKEVKAAYKDGVIAYTPEADLADGRVSVNVTLTREDSKVATKSWSFYVGEKTERLYFGQLHAHTAEYSDGSGTLKEALDYINALPESANVNFVAFTDHSNYFDNDGTANPEDALYDMSKASSYAQGKWGTYQNTIREFNKSANVVALPGFEMTWSGGPGHINTFNTPGIVSRNNTTLNNKTDYAGMKAYYALLSREEGKDSISQFNHPGDTFGTFGDFAFWDAVIDQRMRMVEVGNGEGAIGSGGYFPSYEYYIMALDKGWHVAPTNNQDNHKGRWGNANEARDVILTDNFTEEGIYQALRDLRAYSTEDKNLEIYYTLNGQKLGTTITEVPENLELKVNVNDPDGSDKIQKVEVVVNSGAVAHTWADEMELAKGDLSVTLKPDYSYYFIRVTQADGDLAVTAPVWVGEHIKLGISSFTSKTELPVTGEPLTLVTSFFNGQSTTAKVKSITYTINGSEVIGTDMTEREIPASGTLDVEFNHTFTKAKVEKVVATAVMELEGKQFTFTAELSLDIMEASQLSYIGIDASHYNEYVAGNYKDSMGNFSKLAIPYGLRTNNLTTSQELIDACNNPKYKALILTAPSRRLADSHTDPRVYSKEELAAIKAFNDRGGMVILAGWSDHYENPEKTNNHTGNPFDHMAETQNKILETLGSSLRISDDATYDDQYNGGQNYRLYFNCYGSNFLTQGIVVDKDNLFSDYYTQQFSHYGGASIYAVDGSGNPAATLPATVSPVVFGHAGTYSVDADEDGMENGLGGADSVPKYKTPEGDNRLMIMAMEQLEGKGTIIVSGAAFMSNFEVKQEEVDSSAQMGYSNYKICENLAGALNPMKITPISEVHAQKEEGIKYVVEGVVTSNASGYDKDTAFFDCIYLQDSTGGVNCFPVAGNYKIGDKLRIVGTTSSYQGERQLAVMSVQKLGEETPVEPKEITAAQLNDLSVLGQLIKISGTITVIEKENGLIQTIMVKDSQGGVARVFIDGYITAGKEVEGAEVGGTITVTGLASYDNTFKAPEGPFPRIRIKDRADVVCGPAVGGNSQPSQGGNGGSSQEQGNSSSFQQSGGGSSTTTTTSTVDRKAPEAAKTTQPATTPTTQRPATTNQRRNQTPSVTRITNTQEAEDKKETKIEVLDTFGEEHISQELKSLGYDTPSAIEEYLVSVLEKLQENVVQANRKLYEVVLMYKENGAWLKADERHFPANGRLRVEMDIPEESDPEKHDYHIVHMFSKTAFGKKAGDHESIIPTVITDSMGEKKLEFYVTGLSPIMISWTEKEEVALAEEAVATEPVIESQNETVLEAAKESNNTPLIVVLILAIAAAAVAVGWLVIKNKREE